MATDGESLARARAAGPELPADPRARVVPPATPPVPPAPTATWFEAKVKFATTLSPAPLIQAPPPTAGPPAPPSPPSPPNPVDPPAPPFPPFPPPALLP